MRITWAAPGRLPDPTAVLALIAAGVLLAARVIPFERVPFSICPMRNMLHPPCPACGMTRAFCRVMHGHWESAFTVSPLGSLLALTAAGFVTYAALRSTVLRRGPVFELASWEKKAWRVGLVSLFLANWTYLLISGAAT